MKINIAVNITAEVRLVEVKKLLKPKTSWHDLKAFNDKKIFITDGNQYFNRPGPRLIESLEIFAEIIHPDFFNFEQVSIHLRTYRAQEGIALRRAMAPPWEDGPGGVGAVHR